MNLTKDIGFQQEMFEAIKDDKKREIRKVLNQIHLKNESRKTINIYSWKLQAIAAAVVILFVSGGLIGDFYSNTPLNQSLYSNYFNPDNAVLSVRSLETVDSKLQEGMYYFGQGEYVTAISNFQSEADNMLGKLYTGFSYMKLEEYEKAEALFVAIIADEDNLFLDQAEWNLGLCYLVNTQEEEAEELFAKIADGNTVYAKNANKILEELKNK